MAHFVIRYLKTQQAIEQAFEIATLAKDYYTESYGGTTGGTIDTAAISYVITTFTGLDGGGTNHGSKCSNTYRLLRIFRVLGWCKSRLRS